MMQKLNYRADIDGLRALAVLLVLFFHAEIPPFSGGFIGVDVFFVISGFLITRLIAHEYQQGTFSFVNFYARRARRLLPAAFFIYTLGFIGAYLLFIPEHFERFGHELISAVFSFSNFYFWREANYFDTEAVYKLLLHTWSLSVEEQFYLLWPTTLVLLLSLKKRWLLPSLLVAAAVVSLVLNQIFLPRPAAIFYLIPFRAYEFCIGALLVWVTYQPKNPLIKEFLLCLGLGMIVYAAVTFNKTSVFPYVNALIPCLGAALAIYAGEARFSRKLLSNRPTVFVGLISYSLYLTHWPALVLYKYYRFKELTHLETAGVLACSAMLAVFMYYYIEIPCRKTGKVARWPAKRLAIYCLSVACLLAYAGHYVEQRRGMPRRVSIENVSEAFARGMEHEKCIDGYGYCERDARPAEYAVVGDSHSNGMKYLLGSIAAENKKNIEVYTTVACLALDHSGMDCADEIDRHFQGLIDRHMPNIFLVSNWNPLTHSYNADRLLENIRSTIRKLRANGANVYVYGAMPLMVRTPTSCFQRPLSTSLCDEFMEPMNYEQQMTFNSRLKKAALDSGARYLDFFAMLCNPQNCRVAYDGLSMYADRFHFNGRNIAAYIYMMHPDKKTLTFDDIFTK